MEHNTSPEASKKHEMLVSRGENSVVLFIIKKTEKLCAALYILTDFLGQLDPLARTIREHSLALVSLSFSFSESSRGNGPYAEFEKELRILKSLLSVAALSRLVSEMNKHILEQEMDIMLNYISHSAEGRGMMLSSSFFAEGRGAGWEDGLAASKERHPSDVLNTGARQPMPVLIKDTDVKDNMSYKKVQKERLYEKNNLPSELHSRTNRQDEILAVFKKNKKAEMSIKDISGTVTGCSEKTIQRELLDLVQKGVLKKEGERRWSRYSLLTLDEK